MTYLEYLLFFIILPIILLLIANLKNNFKDSSLLSLSKFLLFTFILSMIALIYTTPWDNYLVANKIWYYDPVKVLGIIFGYVPIEEYSFFILETILVCFTFALVLQHRGFYFPTQVSFKFTQPKILVISSGFILWICFLASFLAQTTSMMYLNLLFLWALPPIIFQLVLGWDIIILNWKKLSLLIIILGAYLSLTDVYAITDGIWAISPIFTTGLKIIIPIEEITFFFLTVVLISFGLILLTGFSYTYHLQIRKNTSENNSQSVIS